MLGSPLYLVHGLRSEARRDLGEDWCELMTRILCRDWLAERSDSTEEAETGLGIDGKPHYFYVMRTEHQYGFIVFLFAEVAGAKWPSGACGTSPFDSGGWWHGKITTSPCLDGAARRRRFKDLDRPLEEWQSAFSAYITSAYATNPMLNYVNGQPPTTGCVPEIVLAEPPNDARAWTWEVRIPHSLVASRVQLVSVCMTDEDEKVYRRWLTENVPEQGELGRREELNRWLDNNAHTVVEGRSVVAAIKNRLIAGISNDG